MISGSITVTKGPKDPLCTRVSLGGSKKLGHYCVYRGTVEDAVAALECALIAMRAMRDKGIEPPVSDINQIGAQGRS